MKQFLLFTCLVLSIFRSAAQQPIAVFSDSEIKPNTKLTAHFKTDSCIYIGGISWDTLIGNPYVAKINSQGKEVWKYKIANPALKGVWGITACDSAVYVYTADAFGSQVTELHKLKSSDGSLVWGKTLSGNINIFYNHVKSYTDTTMVVMSGSRFICLRKSNGAVIEDKTLPVFSPSEDQVTTIDYKGYLYYGGKDTIYKFDNVKHDSIIWKRFHRAFPVYFHETRGMLTDSNYLYLGGELYHSTGRNFLKLDLDSGNIVAKGLLPRSEYYINEFTEHDGFLYGALSQHSFGGVNTYIECFKMDKQTMNLVWYSQSTQVPFLPNVTYTGSDMGNKAIDIDSKGDVYGTGYYGNGSGQFFTFKMNGLDGNVLWKHAITDDSSRYDTRGGGSVAWLHHDKIYFLGTLRPRHPGHTFIQTTGAIIESDTTTGNITSKEFFGGTYKFASKVIDIQKMQNGDVITIVQLGRGVQVLRTDSMLNPVWEKKIYLRDLFNNEVLTADRMVLAPNGNIAFCGTSYSYEDFVTNTVRPDSLLYYQLDSNGNIISISAYDFTSLSGSYIIDMLYDGTYATIYYVHNNKVEGIGFTGGSQSTSATVLNSAPFMPPRHFAITLNTFINVCAKTINPGVDICTLGKLAFSGSVVGSITTMTRFSTLGYVDNNRVLVGGQALQASMLSMYSLTQGDTLWTYTGAPTYHESYTHFLYDSASNSVYAVCRLHQTELSFQKFNATTGKLLWAIPFVHNHTAVVNDLEYDKFNHKLIGVGSVENGFNDYSGATWIIDSSGVALDTIFTRMTYNPGNLSTTAAATSTYNINEINAALTVNSQLVLIGATTKTPPLNSGAWYGLAPNGILSVQNISKSENELNVYPNPFGSGINVDVSEFNMSTQLYLYDLQGRLLKIIKMNSTQSEMYIDLSGLQPGCYLLETENNRKRFHSRIVKE